MSSNIRTGQMSDWITDGNRKSAVSLILSELMPDLAVSIDLVCQEKSWQGIIKKLWPRTKYVQAIITGSIAQYVPMLEFYSVLVMSRIPLYQTWLTMSSYQLTIIKIQTAPTGRMIT